MDEVEQKAFNELKTKAETLEGQVKVMVKPEEHQKVLDEHQKAVAELTAIKTEAASKAKAAEDAAKAAKEAELTTKRAELVKKGLPEDKVKVMSAEQIAAAELVVTSWKPGSDLGGGSGGSSLAGISLFELGKLAYTK